MNFCQFGGHESSIAPRIQDELVTIFDGDLLWNICNNCTKMNNGDPTMDILLNWTKTVVVNRLPESLKDMPLK
jgi:hypothetical protein